MKKNRYLIVGITLLAILSGCGSDTAKEDVKRAKESNKRLEESEQEPFVFKEENGEVILTKYNGKDSVVVIPDEYKDKPITGIADTAFKDSKQLETLTIPYTVQTIDNNTLEEQSGTTLLVYRCSMGETYALQRQLNYKLLGDNPMTASEVTIYNEDGTDSEILSPGQESSKAFMQGVSFQEQDGESVLTLDNSHTGNIAISQYGSLTIELADGSVNTITGSKGNDGISSNGCITITGNGSLTVCGSDLYSLREGERNYVGYGIYLWGDLTIENHVKLTAKAGNSKSRAAYGLLIEEGNLSVDNSWLELYGNTSEEISGGGLLISSMGDPQYGNLNLVNAKITEGGQEITMENEGTVSLRSIGNGEIKYIEDVGLEGHAAYVRIEPELQN